MSEFGNEASTAAFRASEKVLEMLFKLFKFIGERHERVLKKQQVKVMKDNTAKENAKNQLDKRVGYVRMKQLQKSGEPLTAFQMNLSEEKMKRFSELAKRYGLVFTSVSDTRATGEIDHVLMVRAKDMAVCKVITDKLNEELKLEVYDKQISELENKETLSPQEQKDLDYLKKERAAFLREGSAEFNKDNANIIFDDVCGAKKDEALSFNAALNRFTDRDYSRSEPYYICERTTPTSYIELDSSREVFRGEEYTKTDYTVFNNGVQVVADNERTNGIFTDERFEGRPKYYWQSVREEMKAKGGFSDDVVVFQTKKELERYQALYAEQQKELAGLEQQGTSLRDYVAMQEQLNEQLEQGGAELKNGVVVDKAMGKAVSEIDIASIESAEEKARIAECLTIGKQIENYKHISKLEVALEMDRQSLDGLAAGTPEHTELKAKIIETERSLSGALKQEEKLMGDRSRINGVQAVSDVDKEYAKELQKAAQERTSEGLERQADEARLNDLEIAEQEEERVQTLEEWKGEVEAKRTQTEHSAAAPTRERGEMQKGVSTSRDDR